MKWEKKKKKGVKDHAMVVQPSNCQAEATFSRGEAHQLNFAQAKFEMPTRYPMVMYEGGRRHIRLEMKVEAKVIDL